MKMFFSVPKLNAGGAYWHNGLCIQIMEALCHIYGFAYCHLITVLPKIMKISWYGRTPQIVLFLGQEATTLTGILVFTGY